MTDRASNRLVLVLRTEPAGNGLRASIVSLAYNESPAVGAPDNDLVLGWQEARGGGLTSLRQELSVGRGRAQETIRADYRAATFETDVKVKPNGGKSTYPGLVLPRMTTASGGLEARDRPDADDRRPRHARGRRRGRCKRGELTTVRSSAAPAPPATPRCTRSRGRRPAGWSISARSAGPTATPLP